MFPFFLFFASDDDVLSIAAKIMRALFCCDVRGGGGKYGGLDK